MLYATPIILASYYFGGKLIRNIVIDQLNEQLNVRATVYAVNLSGLRNFPKLSIELTNVRINESHPHFNQKLLRAQKVVVVFNPIKLLSGNNEIEKIELRGGAVRLYTDENGLTNFDLFKPTESESDDALSIDLKKVLLSDFQCIYVDETQGQSFNFKTDNISFAGKFDDEHFKLKTNGDALFDHLTLSDVNYILGKRVHADLALDINQKLKAYHIEKGSVALDNLTLNVKGDILLVNDQPDLDLELEGNNIDVQSILSVLPNDIAYQLRDLKSSGNIGVNGTILGSLTESKWPEIDLKFSFENASISSKKRNLHCDKINLNGRLKNKSDKALQMYVDLKEFNMKKSSFSGNFTVDDLQKPTVKFAAKGLLDFNDIAGLLTDAETTEWYGKSLFNIEGLLPYDEKLEAIDYNKSTVAGDIELRDVSFTEKENKLIENLFVKTRIAGNNLTKTEVKGQLWHNDVNYAGEISHWQSYLAGSDRLQISGKLISESIDLGFTEGDTTAPSSSEDITIDFDVDTDLELTVKKFVWGNLKASNLSGDLHWFGKKMNFSNLVFDAWDGTNQLDGKLIETPDSFFLYITSLSEGVSLEKLLDDFENFDQTEFNSEILKGKLTTTVDLSMAFDKQFNVIEDKLICLANVEVVDGQLKNYEPMKSLSTFVELEDLLDIRFERIENTIEIKNRIITIPTMEVKSNAMNLELGGTHDFDNYMNYRMKIKITELLANKSGWVKRKKERQLEDNPDGGLSAYILMVGPPDDLKIKYDRKAVKEKIKEEIKNERKDFFQQLKKEIKREKSPTEDKQKVQWDE